MPGHKKKVLILGPTPPPYHGNATFTAMVLESAELREVFDLVHLDTSDRRSLENMGRLDAANVLLALRHAARLVYLIARCRPEIVYLGVSQNEWAYSRDAVFIVASKVMRRRVVTHLHGGDFRAFYQRTSGIWRWLVRWTSAMVDAAIVLGEGLRPLYEGLVPHDRLHAVPNGIRDPFPELGQDGAWWSGNGDAPRVVTFLSTLFRPKGFLELLEAAALLRNSDVPFRFVFAGAWFSETERREAWDLVQRHRLEGIVSFPGVIVGPQKKALWRDTDIFVFPGYQAEGLPLVILEAMAAGVPVVATPKGAIPDAVIDGETGLIVPECDPQTLAAAVLRLGRDATLRRRMGDAGRIRYLAEFTELRCTERLAQVLQAVCALPPTRSA